MITKILFVLQRYTFDRIYYQHHSLFSNHLSCIDDMRMKRSGKKYFQIHQK